MLRTIATAGLSLLIGFEIWFVGLWLLAWLREATNSETMFTLIFFLSPIGYGIAIPFIVSIPIFKLLKTNKKQRDRL